MPLVAALGGSARHGHGQAADDQHARIDRPPGRIQEPTAGREDLRVICAVDRVEALVRGRRPRDTEVVIGPSLVVVAQEGIDVALLESGHSQARILLQPR